MHPPLSVRVAGSTSNLGPGFDCLGLAFSLWLDVRVEAVSGARTGGAVELGELAGEARAWPRDASNVLCVAFERARTAFGVEPAPVAFHVRSEIPVGRGLGSSGAACAAGLLLAAALAQRPIERGRLLEIGLAIEGHPDNVTASLHSGLTLGVPHERGLAVLQPELDARLGWAVAWPVRTLSTPDARRVLPYHIPFADAVENPRRLAALLAGLARGDEELVRIGAHDRLHERHRLPLIPGAADALQRAREAGAWLATISGAGSGLVACGPRARAEALADALRDGLEAAEPGAVARVVDVVRDAPSVVAPAR
jgi:homoserine kinase